eukprot:1065333-Pleurochrysis_carterae.AAC.1
MALDWLQLCDTQVEKCSFSFCFQHSKGRCRSWTVSRASAAHTTLQLSARVTGQPRSFRIAPRTGPKLRVAGLANFGYQLNSLHPPRPDIDAMIVPEPSRRVRFIFTATSLDGKGVQLQEVHLFGVNAAGSPVVLDIIAAENPNGASAPGAEISEGPGQVIDGNVETPGSKWLDLNMATRGNSTLVLTLAEPAVVVSYEFYTANHARGRDPIEWTFWSENERGEWLLLDSRRINDPTPLDFS